MGVGHAWPHTRGTSRSVLLNMPYHKKHEYIWVNFREDHLHDPNICISGIFYKFSFCP